MNDCRFYSDEVFTVSEFLTPAECDAYVVVAEGEGFTDAPITTTRGPVLLPEVRDNTRVMIDDVVRAAELWVRAADWVPKRLGLWQAVGVNERLRFYRYEVGQQFDWHYDGYFERANGQRSHLTFMVYLNDGFQGGETSFEFGKVVPAKGTALFFIHELLHKGEPVDEGTKYVLRTDVMYERTS
jgi:hypothetical protein